MPQHLDGFTIAGFRNYPLTPQWVAPLARVNVFIGTNNAGKSNILRFIKRVVRPLLAPRSMADQQLSGVDVPRDGKTASYHEILLPIKTLTEMQTPSGRAWQEAWTAELLRLQGFDEHHIKLAIRFPHTDNAPNFPSEHLQVPGGLNAPIWNYMWIALTHYTGGGSLQEWYTGVQNALIRLVLKDINPYYIRTFRQITTRLEGFSDEYTLSTSGDHIIDELAELANPDWDQQHKKVQFEKLRDFVAEIIEDDSVQIEIPTNRKTINVKAGDDYLPLEALGSGIHQVFLLAAAIILKDNQVILLEEPEVHLHPGLQRKLMNFVMNSTTNQVFIATHSAAIIDTPGANVFGVSQVSGKACVRPLLTSLERYSSCRELGYRASDLLQSNAVIWVEGPSDRIYLLAWMRSRAPDLREGVHFSIMFYGGKLLSHLSVEDDTYTDFINLLPICRSPAILIDSDKGSAVATLRETKIRVVSEFARNSNFSWITAGREIENYYSYEQREEAIRHRHPQAESITGGRTRFSKPLAYKLSGSAKEKTADKVAVAKYLTEKFEPDWDNLGLGRKLDDLFAYIHVANA